MTDSRPDTDPTSPKPRGLWSLMGGAPPPADATDAATAGDVTGGDEEDSAPSEESSAALVTEDSPATDDASTDEEPPVESPSPKRRGLWGMMRQVEAEPSTHAETAEIESSSTEAEPDPNPDSPPAPPETDDGPDPRLRAARGLFTLMQRGDANARRDETSDAAVATDEESLSAELTDEDEVGSAPGEFSSDERSVDDDESGDEAGYEYEELVEPQPTAPPVIAPALMMDVIDPEELEPPRFRLAAAQARRQGWIGFACGILAVAASALAMLPQIWSGLPATGLGFAAIIAGYLVLTGAARREITISTRAASLIGMLLGTLGVFLGPLLFANLGRSLREGTGQQLTHQHLQQFGGAIDRHYARHEAYPIGGTFARNDAGIIKGQHGWMTFLLPFVGQDELYHSIEMSQPFDAPINRSAMGRDVVTYFAAGGNREKIGQGFSVSHFAGVGGEIDDDRGLSHVGIFERDVAVKRDEVTDGLSNTLIVGELAGTYPPWGDPENWRTIGRGLNRDVNGFGSANGNGTTFLLGDGTVKFFSNKTDTKLLEQLSTRDGAE